MVEKYCFGVDPIPYHAWHSNKQQVAIAPNSQEIHVYEYDKSIRDWIILDKLNKHDLRITGIDWAPKTNRIVTCSEDRDAYVWTEENKKWKPTQVLLRINRAATCVKWSPDENKFAAGSGTRLISVCYFEQANNWWVSKHIKKPIKSTVTTLDWHPNNVLLAAGSADFKVKVFSGFIKEIESTFPSSPWGGKSALGTLMTEINNSTNFGGWIRCVSFNHDGNRLCWIAHDSSISIADVSSGSLTVTKLKTDMLPFLSCLWINHTTIVAAGYGCCPVLYSVDKDNQMHLLYKLDKTEKREMSGISAMKKFQSLDRQAKVDNDISLKTIHQNTVTSIRPYATDSKGNITKLSTTGLDGQLVIWYLNDLENGIRDMRI